MWETLVISSNENNDFAKNIGADGYSKDPKELIVWLDKIVA